jgi:peroxiredoxin (alkyl hydroperoxide reductase subunit C)
MPANWPNNELIGSKVIIPPASSEKEAKERLEKAKMKEIEAYDWWFAYKEVKVE